MPTDPFFPFEQPRPGQMEVIEDILQAFSRGKKVVFLEAPTGSGKSAIAYTVARHFKKSFYLTSTKILQSQLIQDFGKISKMETLKGRNSYNCKYWPVAVKLVAKGKLDIRQSLIRQLARPDFNFNCNVGYCKTVAKKTARGECRDKRDPRRYCDYWKQVEAALASDICVMNFDSFLYQTAYSSVFKDHTRTFLCADECHNVENKLLDFVSLTISDRDLNIFLEEKADAEVYADYFGKIDLARKISMALHVAREKDDIRKAERLENLQSRLAMFMNELDDNQWVCNYQKKHRYRVIEIKPLFVRKFAKRLIFSKANHILMMSATILSSQTMIDALGLKRDEVAAVQMPSYFPVENRPIFLEPCGSLSYKNKQKTFPVLVKTVDKICSKHHDKKGIIHTHNFEIADLLIERCKNSKRFLFQRDFDSKEEMLRYHGKQSNSVIVAPAMHEGLDLANDLSRFQILCKIPYPNQNNNPQLKERVKLSWNYYVWLTALKFVQSYGRSIRHDEDWAHTYIVDSDFARFLDMSVDILPEWFLEAIDQD
jgi:Rad3-related DNA helicase